MSSARTVFKLEPVRRFVTLAVLGHLVLAAAVWWWIQIQRYSAPRVADPAQLSWMETTDVGSTMLEKNPESPSATPEQPKNSTPPPIVIRTQSPAPPVSEPEDKPVPKAILIRPPDKPAGGAAPPAATPSPAPTAAPGEVSRFVTVSRLPSAASVPAAGLDQVDRALIDSFLKVWTAPRASDQRSMLLEVALDRAGRLISFKPVQTSGDKAVDASVLEAADRLEKVGESLPPSFVGERYSVQVRFHVE